MKLSQEDLLSHVAAHAGGLTAAQTWCATHAVLSALGAHLSPALRERVADELDPSLGGIVCAAEASLAKPLEAHVMEPGMTVGKATELVASVCRVLAEELAEDTLAAIRHALPETIARHFPTSQPELARRGRARSRWICAARPGGAHPISETPTDHRHEHSIAADNPHADVKLSSTPGTTQEREHETLAEGRDPRR